MRRPHYFERRPYVKTKLERITAGGVKVAPYANDTGLLIECQAVSA
jgi:hypothetical protein